MTAVLTKEEAEAVQKANREGGPRLDTAFDDKHRKVVNLSDDIDDEEEEAIFDTYSRVDDERRIMFLSRFSESDLADAIALIHERERNAPDDDDDVSMDDIYAIEGRDAKRRNPELQKFVDGVFKADKNTLASLIGGMRY